MGKTSKREQMSGETKNRDTKPYNYDENKQKEEVKKSMKK